MFRYITAIFFLTAFAAQTFQQAAVILGYYINTASYAKNCENKARPRMHCNGKCQMMKKLQEQEKKNQQLPERKLQYKSEVVSSKSFFAALPYPSICENCCKRFSFYTKNRFDGFPAAIFQPPRC